MTDQPVSSADPNNPPAPGDPTMMDFSAYPPAVQAHIQDQQALQEVRTSQALSAAPTSIAQAKGKRTRGPRGK